MIFTHCTNLALCKRYDLRPSFSIVREKRPRQEENIPAMAYRNLY